MNKNSSIKLNEKTVYDISSVNQDENPNNAVLVAFYACRADDSISMMNLDVIQRLFKEEFFGQLRTKEQLGYLVSSAVLPFNNSVFFTLRV